MEYFTTTVADELHSHAIDGSLIWLEFADLSIVIDSYQMLPNILVLENSLLFWRTKETCSDQKEEIKD